MAAENDLLKLYSKRILALTADIPFTDRLDQPDATAKKRSPLCGSTVTVDLKVENGHVTDYAQDVKACALGQAAAAVIGHNIIGRNRDEIQSARDALLSMLKSDGDPPNTPFSELETLLPAREYKNRHASIMLTFDAILEAFDQTKQNAVA